MKNIIKEFIIGIFIIFILTNIISYVRKPKLSSNHLPKMEMKLLDGSDYRVDLSKPLILHFWGTWCPTCKLEIDNIERVSKKYEVLTIAVNSGDKMVLQKYLNNKSLTFRVVNDNHGEWAKKFNVEAYPTTFIYDSNGKLRFTEVGYTTIAGLLARMAIIDE